MHVIRYSVMMQTANCCYTIILQNGQTILYISCAYNHLEVVKVLLEYGAQVNKVNNVSEFNLLNNKQ